MPSRDVPSLSLFQTKNPSNSHFCCSPKTSNDAVMSWRYTNYNIDLWPSPTSANRQAHRHTESHTYATKNITSSRLLLTQEAIIAQVLCLCCVNVVLYHWCTDLFMCNTVHIIRRYNVNSHWKVQGRNFTPEKRSLIWQSDSSILFFHIELPLLKSSRSQFYTWIGIGVTELFICDTK